MKEKLKQQLESDINRLQSNNDLLERNLLAQNIKNEVEALYTLYLLNRQTTLFEKGE